MSAGNGVQDTCSGSTNIKLKFHHTLSLKNSLKASTLLLKPGIYVLMTHRNGSKKHFTLHHKSNTSSDTLVWKTTTKSRYVCGAAGFSKVPEATAQGSWASLPPVGRSICRLAVFKNWVRAQQCDIAYFSSSKHKQNKSVFVFLLRYAKEIPDVQQRISTLSYDLHR